MIPWELLDIAPLPGGGELRLWRRGTEWSIRVDAIELMNSRRGGSEAMLAAHACRLLAGTPRPRLLIGGLGLGFTLRAALAALPADATLTVAELVPAVVAWARGPLAALFTGCLDDPRVTLVAGDVGELVRGAEARWHAVLLDVDNGPAGLVGAGNDRLYAAAGLAAARQALRPGGLLAIWSERPDAAFVRLLRRVGFTVDERREGSGAGRRGARHVIWLARRP